MLQNSFREAEVEVAGIKAVVLNAPTGYGKTNFALEMAKEEPLILSLPTIKLAFEVEKRAKEKGIDTVVLLGRGNYPCGYKVQKVLNLPDDPSEVKRACIEAFLEGRKELFQGYLCCRRKGCLYDMFKEKKEEAQSARLVITTHALLNVCGFTPVLPQGRKIFIDEVQSFLRALKNPVFPFTRFSTAEFRELLIEMKDIVGKKKVSPLLDFVSRIEKTAFQKLGDVKARLLWVVKKNKELKVVDTQTDLVVKGLLLQIDQRIVEFLSRLTAKEKVVVGDILSAVRELIRIVVKGYSQPGTYALVRVGEYGFAVEVKQVLFSSSMWARWRGIVRNLRPGEIWFASATIPDALKGLLSIREIKEVETKSYIHRFNSTLDIIVGRSSYSYETREEFLEEFIELFKKHKRDKGAVILASSYEDIRYLAEKLGALGYSVAAQREGQPLEPLVYAYEKGEYDVLIGNRSLWEGVNIRRDSDFFVVKVPYYSPDDPDYKAVEEFHERNAFPIHKSDTKDLMIQGLGRIIRNNGEHKRVFIADRRVLDFDCLFAEIPTDKRYLVL